MKITLKLKPEFSKESKEETWEKKTLADPQILQEFSTFYQNGFKIPVSKQKVEQAPEILQVSSAADMMKRLEELQQQKQLRYVLVVTLYHG